MKKVHLMGFVLSACFVALGVIFYSWLKVLDIILILLGIALFLVTFWEFSVSKAQRCPNCNGVIYTGHIRTIARQKDGVVQCEKCGTLVRVAQKAK